MTPSLFGEEEIIVWDGLKNLPELVLEKMANYVKHPSSRSFLLLGAETSKGFTEFYQKSKQELILLDFSEEKPWDKQKRVQQELVQRAQQEGKRLTPGAVTRLCDLCGFDPLLLEQEFAKISTYVGARKEIEERDVEKIGSFSHVATGWQIAEGLVWGKTVFVAPSLVDLSFLLALIGQVRFYLQQGRQLGWCLEQRKSPEEIGKILPQLRSTQMQKLTTSLKTRKMPYFDEALDVLFEVELLSKNSNLSPVALLDLLQMRLTHIKQVYTR
jgi:DNA polymerase III delta subunit